MVALTLLDDAGAPRRIAQPAPATVTGAARPTAGSVHAACSGFRHGRHDPTTQLSSPGPTGWFRRATWTPDGPGTITIRWRPAGSVAVTRPAPVDLDVSVEGPGGEWLEARAGAMAGLDDVGATWLESDAHPVVADAARRGRHLRLGRSDDLYHELLPTVIEQRITAGEAVRQWARLCRELGEPAPGGDDSLRLPPAPRVLARQPTWWFHPLGIERSRAGTLVEIARRADSFWGWAELGSAEVDRRLRMLRGVGVWTSGSVRGPALGDPDALCVGDFHAKNVVAWALDRRARGTDDEMLARLAPYSGQRGRVLRMLSAAGHTAPKFGPRQRILPMSRW